MSSRPLSLARLRDLPDGAIVVDRNGRLWRRIGSRPAWFRCATLSQTASPSVLLGTRAPLRYAPNLASLTFAATFGDGS